MKLLARVKDATCPCGSTSYREILTADRYCVYGEAVQQLDYSLIRCVACGLVRTRPEPEDHEHGPFRDEGFLDPYLERLELFERLLQPTIEEVVRLRPPPARLVDVGANIGLIVRMADAAGYDATGIELNEAAVEHGVAGGLDLRATPLEDAGFEPGSLDVIILSATAEHLHDLAGMFGLCRELLAPRGLLYVSNSPNIRSYGYRAERELWYGIQPTGHVWQFTPATLRARLEAAGFRVVGARTHNLHRDFGRNRRERLRKLRFALAEHVGLGDAVGVAAVKP